MSNIKQMSDMLNFIASYQEREGQGPANLVVAGHCRVSERTIVNWKQELRAAGAIVTERVLESAGRAKLETSSWVTVAWEVVNRLLGSTGAAIKELRKKKQRWMGRLARLRRAILSNQSSIYTSCTSKIEKEALKIAQPAKTVQPIRAGSIWDQSNERFDRDRQR